MKQTILVFAVTVMALASVPAARQGAGGPMGDALRSAWRGARLNIKESADLMPEANYDFKPTPEVRSFGAILAHLAGANYIFCSAARGETSPHAEADFEKSATTRDAIIKALGDSLAYCDEAFAASDAALTQMVDQPFGGGKGPRAAALIGELGHMNEHYGNLVTYFRLKGIVPPSSRR